MDQSLHIADSTHPVTFYGFVRGFCPRYGDCEAKKMPGAASKAKAEPKKPDMRPSITKHRLFEQLNSSLGEKPSFNVTHGGTPC